MLARLFASLVAGFSAIGDNGDPASPIVWPSPNVTIMIGAGGSDDIAGDSDLVAIRSALAAWSAPGCTSLRLIDGGLDASPDDGNDGVNRIFFRERDWPAELSGAAAITIQWETSGSPDIWHDADILLNGDQLAWSTTGEVQRYDVQAVVTHELGHLIGLDHATRAEATMYFVSPRGNTQRRTLHADDVKASCFLYPASGSRMCMSDDDCPLMITPAGASVRLACTTGQCGAGRAGYGADCLGGGDCTSGVCADDPNSSAPDDPGSCSESCAIAACPNGDLCWNDLCYGGRDDCVLDADCGQNNVVCAVDLDGRRRCTRLCLMDSHCPSGVCHGGTGANPPGFCREPGSGGDGASCSDGYDCASLTCAGSGTETTCAGGVVMPGEDAGAGGVDADAPAPDAAPGMDAGRPGNDAAMPRLDAGVIVEADAGAVEPEPLEGSGCGCSGARGRDAPFALLLLFLVRQIVDRRRAHRTR